MITGRVIGLRARIGVIFRLSGQPDLGIAYVVDAGFEGALTLPAAAVAALKLPSLGQLERMHPDAFSLSTRA